MKLLPAYTLLTALIAFGCGNGEPRDRPETEPAPARETTPADDRMATAIGTGDESFTESDIERGRRDTTWRSYVRMDSTAAIDSVKPDSATMEKWTGVTVAGVNGDARQLPLHSEAEGATVLATQILLDRALMSPGVIDGRWGRNTEEAVYWLQEREGLPKSGRVDSATFARLRSVAGGDRNLIQQVSLTADDVKGPFVQIPSDVYEQAKIDCMCYRSLGEKLAERFHTTTALLEKLNPDVRLDDLTAGATLQAPAVRDTSIAAADSVARIVISDGGRFLHALDAGGRILYHFPTTLGSSYAPSPSGNFRVTRIAQDPTWHYQPKLLTGEPDDRPDAVVPAGPNSPVGVVWMALSEPHYGIHGTGSPETIGYDTSHGCVRLTNWDASFLSMRIRQGVTVEFRDTRRTPVAEQPAPQR
jgi:lipoprotein-anchoring transpeptidase ErfK/SrfK